MTTRALARHVRPKTREAPPPLAIADGTLEALKWLALVLMTLDHVNKFLFAQKLPFVFEAARLALPLFAFVLAYNLARPGTAAGGASTRTMKRLLIYGAIATPMFVALVGWWPLNILFTLLLSAVVIQILDRGGAARTSAAVGLFVVAGTVVEFWWFGVLSCVLAWAYCRRPTIGRLAAWTGATLALGIVNGNLWALIALPVILAAPHVDLEVPRRRRWFYLYYPAHLGLLLAAQKTWV
jgi:hypothetical protein